MKTIKLINVISSLLLMGEISAQVTVLSSGNVGIGTNNPTVKLQVLGDKALFSSNQSPSFAAMIRCNAANSTFNTPDYTWYGDDQTGFFHPAAWQIGVGIGGTEKFRFNWDGCFYINTTTNPDAEKLSVTNSGNPGYPVMTNNHISNGSYNYAQKFYVDNSLTKSLAVINGSEKFYVYGNGQVESAFGYYTFSDANYKENVNTISKPLDKLLKLRGVTYNYKKSSNDKSTEPEKAQIGLLAQEVEKVIPEVVSTNDKGLKSVAYQNLVGLLIEAIKEQHQTIEDMKQQVTSCCQANSNVSGTSGAIQNANLSTLSQNTPNPFSQNTEIDYTLAPTVQKGILYIFDMQGTLLKTFDNLKQLNGKIQVNGGDLKPGMYLYSLIADGKEIDTKRMILTE